MAKKDKTQPTDLKTELDNAVAALKTQCKDAAFFDAQMERILSLKGQASVKPVRLIVEEKDIVREHKDKTFWIALTKKSAIYHAYGGYTVIADIRNVSSLYKTLSDMLDYLENPKAVTDACYGELLAEREENEGRALTEKERMEYRDTVSHAVSSDTEAKMHVLNAPTWCFTDIAATYEIATTVLSTLHVMLENAQNAALQDEDLDANADFEEAVRGAEHIGEMIKKEKEATNG